MIITCPACNTRYLAETSGFEPDGRTVRCTNCGHSWYQEPPRDGPRAVPFEDEDTRGAPAGRRPLSRIPQYDERPRRRVSTLLGILLAIAVLGGGLAGAYVYRSDVVRAWPPAKGLYSVLNVHVATGALGFRNTSYARVVEEGTSLLVVSGIVVNETDEAIAFSDIRATLRDSQANELDHWDFSIGEGLLEPHGQQMFETKRSSPPANAFDLELKILQDGSDAP